MEETKKLHPTKKGLKQARKLFKDVLSQKPTKELMDSISEKEVYLQSTSDESDDNNE